MPRPQSSISPRTITPSTRPSRMTTFQLFRMNSSSIACRSTFIHGRESGEYDNRGCGTCGSASRTICAGGCPAVCRRENRKEPSRGRSCESGNLQLDREEKNYIVSGLSRRVLRRCHAPRRPRTRSPGRPSRTAGLVAASLSILAPTFSVRDARARVHSETSLSWACRRETEGGVSASVFA